jgi:hypothetical protein
MRITKKRLEWDVQEKQLIMANPDGPNKNASLTEPFRIGQRATGTIGGAAITVLLTKIITPTSAEAKVIRIWNGDKEMGSLGDLYIANIVMLSRENVRWLDIDTNAAQLQQTPDGEAIGSRARRR